MGALLPPPTPEAAGVLVPRQQVCHSHRSCQRQASSLRRWLELSREEPRPEDQEAERQVQQELQEVRPQGALGPLLACASSQPLPFLPAGNADPAAEF